MKELLLEALAETRGRERDLHALCIEAAPDPSGRWRPQDHLAHLAWLRDYEASLLEAVHTGAEIPPDLGEDASAKIYAATSDRAAATVIDDAERAWDRLESAIEACTEEDLQRAHPHRNGRKLIDGSPGDHLGAHLMWCFLEAGDESAAEAVQLWARELSARLFDDPRNRALGSYNVACFYARVGRPDDAIPLLRSSFEGSPDLKEWSLKDPDLDPIRDNAEFTELLAT